VGFACVYWYAPLCVCVNVCVCQRERGELSSWVLNLGNLCAITVVKHAIVQRVTLCSTVVQKSKTGSAGRTNLSTHHAPELHRALPPAP
jgi:hypothetical protein